jgi:acetyltransferase-like isoleucine patch superfamily enzyme
MPADPSAPSAVVKAFHSRREIVPDPEFEIELSRFLKERCGAEGLLDLHARFAAGDGAFDTLMRRAVWRASARRFGHGVHIGSAVGFKHLETFEIGDGAFIGAQSYIQGRINGRCVIGKKVWIGPQSYFDARDLVIEEYVGWGPGAKVLGSAHTGIPADVPIVHTDLVIKRVTIGAWADVGTNAVILPGVTVGKGSQIGAGAVVTQDVPAFSVVAGVPAKFIRWREGCEGGKIGSTE